MIIPRTLQKSVTVVLLALALCLPVSLLTVHVAHAASGEQAQKKRRATGSMTERTYKKLSRIHSLIGESKYDQALKLLEPLSTQLRNDYERAIVYQTYGFVYASQERYSQATAYLEKALALHALPEEQDRSLTFNLAQLYIIQGSYKKGIATLEEWFRTAQNPDAHAYAMLATAYSQDRQYDKAIPALEKAIELSDDPREAWYRLLMSMYYQQKQYARAADVLKIMTARWPDNERYWKQLSSIYMLLRKEKKALSVLDIAYARGFLRKRDELLRLVNLHAYLDDPYEAAQVLEKGMADGVIEASAKHLELLGNLWMSAQENDRAVAAFRKAGRAADHGRIDLRVAYLLIEKEQWKQAEKALNQALNKGGLRHPGKAWLLLGMAAYEQDHADMAMKYFAKATKYPDSRKDANQWLEHIREEQHALSEE